MFETKISRGRPKGTGIDDSDRIARLVALLTTDPDLKPTTAIRCMGITDPSAIRRIRDKYKAALAASEPNAIAHIPLRAIRTTGPVLSVVAAVATRAQG